MPYSHEVSHKYLSEALLINHMDSSTLGVITSTRTSFAPTQKYLERRYTCKISLNKIGCLQSSVFAAKSILLKSQAGPAAFYCGVALKTPSKQARGRIYLLVLSAAASSMKNWWIFVRTHFPLDLCWLTLHGFRGVACSTITFRRTVYVFFWWALLQSNNLLIGT